MNINEANGGHSYVFQREAKVSFSALDLYMQYLCACKGESGVFSFCVNTGKTSSSLRMRDSTDICENNVNM